LTSFVPFLGQARKVKHILNEPLRIFIAPLLPKKISAGFKTIFPYREGWFFYYTFLSKFMP
jgi:hypothetical protein